MEPLPFTPADAPVMPLAAQAVPLAAPRARRPLREAEPAKWLGWLFLAFWGGVGAWSYALSPHPFPLAIAVVCFGLIAGFVQAHRYEGTTFSRVWFGFFTVLIGVLGLIVKVVTLLT